MKKTTVLIADDHKILRETLQLVINNEPGFEVVSSCGDSLEAIEYAQESKPDIILMEVNIAPVSGIEATARIMASNPGAKVIGMSTHCEPVYMKRLLRSGATGYITKISPMDEIIAAIKSVQQGDICTCQDV